MSFLQDIQAQCRDLAGWKPMDGKHCVQCGEVYSAKNVYTTDGWKETRITGLCERCFDENSPPDDDE